MSNISLVTPSEGLLPVPRISPQKKPPRLSVFSRLTSIVRRHPFLSAVLLYGLLTGFVTAIAKSSYNRDKRQPGEKLAWEGNGVCFSLASMALVRFELTRHTNHRSHSSDMVTR